jgi:hypothetical protein
MESRSTDMVVIFAGYKDKMDQFFSYIPGGWPASCSQCHWAANSFSWGGTCAGMQSRVNLHIDFPDMEVPDLVEVRAWK